MKNLWKFRDESGKDQGSGSNERQFGNSSSIIWIVLIFLIGFWIWNLFGSTTEQTEIAYTTFREHVRSGNVSEVTVSGEEIRGTLEKPAPTSVETIGGVRTVQYTNFVTYLPSF